MNEIIEKLICESKGVLNFSQANECEAILKNLNNDKNLLLKLIDMIVQSKETSQNFGTIIFSSSQLNHLKDNKLRGTDKTYLEILQDLIVGANFSQDDNLEEIVGILGCGAINFKLNVEISNEGNINALLDQLNWIASIIEQAQDQATSELAYILDIHFTNPNNSKNSMEIEQQVEKAKSKEIDAKLIERILYQICTHLLSKDVALENIIISSNILEICLQFPQKSQYDEVEEAAFNTLMILRHGLPASLGGVLFSYSDEQNDQYTFPLFLQEINKMKLIKYFPHSFVFSEQNFVHVAKTWGGNFKMYITAMTQLEEHSEQLKAGLNGYFDKPPHKICFGEIEITSSKS